MALTSTGQNTVNSTLAASGAFRQRLAQQVAQQAMEPTRLAAVNKALQMGQITADEYAALTGGTARGAVLNRALQSGAVTGPEYAAAMLRGGANPAISAASEALGAASTGGAPRLALTAGSGGGALVPAGAAAVEGVAPAVAAEMLGAAPAAAAAAPGAAGAAGTAAATAEGAVPAAAGWMARNGLQFTRGGAIRGGAVALGAQMLAGQVDKMNLGGENSGADRWLTGAIGGAGLGAGAALALGGPVGWAALAGLAAGGAIKYIFSDSKTSEEHMTEDIQNARNTIVQTVAGKGMSNDQIKQMMTEFDLTTDMYLQNKDKDGLKAYMQNLSGTLPSLVMQNIQQNQAQKEYNDRLLAMQAQFAPIFQGVLGRASDSAGVAYQAALHAADQLGQSNPQLAAIISSNAAQTRSNTDALMAAYANQMMQVPYTGEAQRYLDQQQIAQQSMQPVFGA